MYELTPRYDNDVVIPGWDAEKLGSFNVAPEGWRQISVAEFAQTHWEIPSHVEYRQIHRTIDGESAYIDDKAIFCTLHFFPDGTGYAMEKLFWQKEIRFFAFGCNHSMRHVGSPGRCLHTYRCDICHYTVTHDSSD